jgi:hypothetical protein
MNVNATLGDGTVIHGDFVVAKAGIANSHAASSNQELRRPCSAQPNSPTIAVTR